MGGGSQRWYDWKDAPASDATGFHKNATPANGGAAGNEGCFFEPQVGVGPTQARGFVLPPGTMEWTHTWRTLSSIKGPALERLYSTDYNAALDTVATWRESKAGVPSHIAEEMEKFFAEEASLLPVTKLDVIHGGQPFGALHALVNPKEHKTPPSMYFDVEGSTGLNGQQAKGGAEVRPWLELLQDGTFSAETLSPNYVPLSYQTSKHWEAALAASAEKHGATHYHLFHMAVIAAERLDVPRAMELLEGSIKLQPTAIAYRCLAALGLDAVESWKNYQLAWEMAVMGEGEHTNTHAVMFQRQLAGEIALYLTTVSMLADHNVTYNGQPLSKTTMWKDLAEFLDKKVPTSAGCQNRGEHCDHDMIVFSRIYMNYQRDTVAGCEKMFDLMKTCESPRRQISRTSKPLASVYVPACLSSLGAR